MLNLGPTLPKTKVIAGDGGGTLSSANKSPGGPIIGSATNRTYEKLLREKEWIAEQFEYLPFPNVANGVLYSRLSEDLSPSLVREKFLKPVVGAIRSAVEEASLKAYGLLDASDSAATIDLDDLKQKIIANLPLDAIILSHGTDAMEHTAKLLDEELPKELAQIEIPGLEALGAPASLVDLGLDSLAALGLKIIMTGANRAMHRADTDAYSNLETAHYAARDMALAGGVYIAFDGEIIPAAEAIKEPFNGTSMKYVSKVAHAGKLRLLDAKIARENQTQTGAIKESLGIKDDGYLDSEAIKVYEANKIRDDHEEFEAMVAREKPKAVLLILYHSSTANASDDEKASVAKMVERLREKYGTVFFAVTENGEAVDFSNSSYDSSVKLREAGVVPLYDMPYKVALAKMQMLARQNHTITASGLIDGMMKVEAGKDNPEIDYSLIDPEHLCQLKGLYDPDGFTVEANSAPSQPSGSGDLRFLA